MTGRDWPGRVAAGPPNVKLIEARGRMDVETGDEAARRRRIAYRAGHRGTREMDWLLGRYAESVVATCSLAELDALEQLIALPDPELHRWILEPAGVTDARFAEAIDRIRRFHGLANRPARTT